MSLDQSELLKKRDVQISKALSYLLRHGAQKEKLSINSNGYILVKDILSHNRLKTHKCTLEDLHRIVENNDKKRFHLKIVDDQEHICATQGHSLKTVKPSDEVLEPVLSLDQLPKRLVHGTNLQNAILIFKSGQIKKMNRNHVHLSPGVIGEDSEVVSGMRYSSNVHIFLKLNDSLLENLKLFKSINSVYLSAVDIPTDLVEKVILKKSLKMNSYQDEIATLQLLLDSKNIPCEIL
ncbi:hypothetical protein Kpol_1054p4 [Vanderwaltozyma polyspora DSM 70294]|uniref:2'-phosphotransferase n=1 Tax=Vanderwaltozyma polyspora (strain ATCC 22028 / DSM 70294 / BCRC 21397 / CBS 2163 / NBRC 10782 / NRRL Y-8283 / UCD 57-17) TaxID=436907 RepID=A7TI93_VANPO|nr:uncharacterized protein Kpol_1054p4 [Vanderwaltozyma polyspora DSM 70294]EDO17959.1 hypothetical protein Kpol_1054p4 [Vanderwaltozyma polyspora DSM 70294]